MKKKSSKKFYVYKLINPKNSLPFYIGKGSGNRMKHHEMRKDKKSKTSSHNNTFLKNKINKVLRESNYIRYQKYYTTNEQEAFNIEVALIKKYGRRDNKTGILCNLTNGGEGVSGHKRTPEWTAKLSAAAHERCKQINQYTMDGTFVKTWKNYKEITPFIDAGSLSKCCSGKIKSVNSFRWTYTGEDLKPWNPPPRKISSAGKIVYQYTLEGKYINSYVSIAAAMKRTSISETSIRNICYGRGKHGGGYYWSFKKIPPKYELSIYQYNLNGDFITGYIDIPKAAILTNLKQHQIRSALKKINNNITGFYWRIYKKDKIDKIIPVIKKTTAKPINQYSLNGKFIKTYPSAIEAVRITNIKGVSNCASGLAQTAGGYVWKYI